MQQNRGLQLQLLIGCPCLSREYLQALLCNRHPEKGADWSCQISQAKHHQDTKTTSKGASQNPAVLAFPYINQKITKMKRYPYCLYTLKKYCHNLIFLRPSLPVIPPIESQVASPPALPPPTSSGNANAIKRLVHLLLKPTQTGISGYPQHSTMCISVSLVKHAMMHLAVPANTAEPSAQWSSGSDRNQRIICPSKLSLPFFFPPIFLCHFNTQHSHLSWITVHFHRGSTAV